MAERSGNREPTSPKVLDRDGVLSVLGYKGEVKEFKAINFLPVDKEVCYKCGKKVYPVERIDVGAVYHRSCFKCRVCNIQLSLRNFQRGFDVQTNTKEVFCNTHVPKQSSGLADKDALGIKSALAAQKAANIRDFERYGIFDAQSALEKVQKQEEDELFSQMSEDRRAQIEALRHFVHGEKQKTVQELVYWFQKRGSSKEEISDGLKKVEFYYSRQLEERIKLLEKRTAAEEQAAVARMTEKHAQEMIALIAEKENMAERDMRRHQEKLRSQLDAHDVASAKIKGNVKEQQQKLQQHLDQQIQQKAQQSGAVPSSASQLPYGHDMAAVAASLAPAAAETTGSDGSSSQLFNQVELVSSVAEKSLSKLADARDTQSHSSGSSGPSNQVEHFSDGKLVVAAAGKSGSTFKPITPVIAEVKLAPDSVRLKDRAFVPQFVKVEVEADDRESAQYGSEDGDYSEYSDYSETEESDELGDEGSYSLEDIERSSMESETMRDERGQPFLQLQQPPKARGQRGTPHPGAASAQPAVVMRSKENKMGKSKEEKKGVETEKQESAAQKRRRERRQQRKHIIDEILKPVETVEDAERDNEINENILNTEVATPKVVPPRETKSKLYTDPAIFEEFDNHALREAKKDHKSYTHLVRELSMNCKNELQKVRAIFIWITAKDLNTMRFEDEVDPDSPLGLLRGIKQGAESYHNLFKRLCSYAGLHCVIIEGYSKGSGYKPGTAFRQDMYRNQWTAVWVERSWRFINCNWGARHVKGPREDKMTYKVDEFYFLTDPHEHIYQHFPSDPKWQLLNSPISLEEFIRLPVVKSPFFNRRLAFAKDYSSVIHVKEGFYELQLVCPRLYNFAAKLVSKDRSTPNEIMQEKMLLRMVEYDVVFLVNLPVPGKYYLDIYVAPNHASESMDHACGFMLNCLGTSKQASLSYPQIGPMGRLPYFDYMGLTEETHVDSYITAHGEFVVAFTASKPVRVTHGLQYYNYKDRTFTECDRYAFPKHRGDSLVSYVVKCPRKGFYVLTFSAESVQDRHSNVHSVYRYLVDYRTPVPDAPSFPRASKRWQHCKLLTPLSGDLPINSNVTFKIESSVAKGMVVVIDDDWHYLDQHGGIWQGVVNTGPYPGKALVYGRIDSQRDKYIPCLEFSIVEMR